MVLGLRMLDGQVHSFNQCKRLHIEPGSRSFAPDLIPTIRKFLVCGLSMITGAVPPSTLIPYLKVLCHYADQADLFGILRWYVSIERLHVFMHAQPHHAHPPYPYNRYWLFFFEMFSRYIKNMCFNRCACPLHTLYLCLWYYTITRILTSLNKPQELADGICG